MKKQKSIAKLKKELDRHFNKYIRNRDAGNPCLACGGPASPAHASHFYASTFTATRWDERNVNNCCVRCNVFLHGNLLGYRKGIIAKYGEKVLEELEALHNQPVKLDRHELEENINYYKGLTEWDNQK